MLIYKTFAKLVKLGLRVYFRKIYFYNDEVVNLNKPVLIASNHPTAFIEPLLIGSTLKKPIYYLVRADIFKDGIIKFFTDAFGMIPVYRFVDGYSGLKNNQEIFRMLYKKLKENNIIVVFAEGNTIQEKRLRPIKKGTARLAFGCYEKYGIEDIDIIPAGVNYTYPNQYRKDVMIEFGEPIQMADYMDVYKEHPNRAIVKLTKELQRRMKQFVICIDDKADETLVEQQFILNRSSYRSRIFPVKELSNEELKSEWKIANAVNQMEDAEKAALKIKSQKYFDQLDQHNLKDHSVHNGNQFFSVFRTLLIILGFIPMLIGVLSNIIPVLIANSYVAKNVKFVEFEAPLRFVINLGLHLLVWIIMMIVAIVTGNQYLLCFTIAMPFLGYFALIYFDIFREWNADRRWLFVNKAHKNELIQMRKSIVFKNVKVA